MASSTNFDYFYLRMLKSHVKMFSGTYFSSLPRELQILLGKYLMYKADKNYLYYYKNDQLNIHFPYYKKKYHTYYEMKLRMKKLSSDKIVAFKNFLNYIEENKAVTFSSIGKIGCYNYGIKFYYDCHNYIRLEMTCFHSIFLPLSLELFETLTQVIK